MPICTICGRDNEYLVNGICRFGCKCMKCKTRIEMRRGCCMSCYNLYSHQVGRGKTTWEQLEREGKVRASRHKSGKLSKAEKDRHFRMLNRKMGRFPHE